jgi:hypothetical protein
MMIDPAYHLLLHRLEQRERDRHLEVMRVLRESRNSAPARPPWTLLDPKPPREPRQRGWPPLSRPTALHQAAAAVAPNAEVQSSGEIPPEPYRPHLPHADTPPAAYTQTAT